MISPFPQRTLKLFNEAEVLYQNKFFHPSLLMYCIFLEQALLVKYIRDSEPLSAKKKMDKIIKIKDAGNLTFGTVLNLVKPLLDTETYEDCKKIKKIRDTIVAHHFFVMQIDPKNKYKLGFYDVSNYRKIVRRLYNLIKNERLKNLSDEDRRMHQEVGLFLTFGDPLTVMPDIERNTDYIENLILKIICEFVRDTVRKIKNELNIPVAHPPPKCVRLSLWINKDSNNKGKSSK